MGANSSPPAPDAATDASIKSKKRKTSDAPLPLSSSPSSASEDATHADLHPEATLERMATALDLSQSFVDRALLDPTLPKSTSLAMEDSRARLQQLTSFVDALRSADVDGVALQLQRMFVSDAGLLATLRDASTRALAQATAANNIPRVRRISSASNSTPSASNSTIDRQTNANSTDANSMTNSPDEDVDMDGDDPRASIHEEEAAQALTGLRSSTSGPSSSTAAAAAAAVAAVSSGVSPPTSATTATTPTPLPALSLPLPSPRQHQLPPQAPTPTSGANSRNLSAIPSTVPYALPSMSPTHSLSIFAPQPSDLAAMYAQHPAGLYVSAPSPSPTAPSPMGTPGALPSIFSRGLLAPIASPYVDASKQQEFAGYVTSPMVTSCTPMMSHLSPFVDWKNLPTPTTQSQNQNQLHHQLEMQDTPVSVTGNMITTDQTSSPIKRKSITAKQLVAAAVNHGANLTLPIAKSLAALERTHPTRKANPRRWTKEEDDALRTAVENHKEKNWKAIAAQVPGRNHTQCLQRWTKVLAPGLVKGHWSPHEDELLRRLVAGGNKNWGEVAAKIPGRTSKQCRERWHNHLDPNIVRGAYTPEEDRIILEAQARLGNRWSVIAAMLPGRTEDAVKIRWKSHCRLWKARKYLRKNGGQDGGDGGSGMPTEEGQEEDEDDDVDDDSSDDEQDGEDEEDEQQAAVSAVSA